MPKVAVCMPVFNDWQSASEVVARIRTIALTSGFTPQFHLIDDGSTEGSGPIVAPDVEIIRLRRNVGHQRAIAVGLARLAAAQSAGAEHGVDAVVVMDSDGEDIPEHVAVLVERWRSSPTPMVIFAKRAKRSEGLRFRAGYVAFKAVHRVLTGRRVEVGNFSIIPRDLLPTVVSVSEIWVHYAAGVMKARIPTDVVPLQRGHRIAGRSKMNTVSLVGHGLGALSIFGEEIVVRSLAACLIGVGLSGAAAITGAIAGIGPLSVIAAVAGAVFLAASIQGMLAAVVLYRLKSMMSVMPIGDAHNWVVPVVSTESADPTPAAALSNGPSRESADHPNDAPIARRAEVR